MRRHFVVSSEDVHLTKLWDVIHDTKTTVKAPNFGPFGNFGPLFQKGLLSLKHARQENEENKSCIKTLDLQI
jgi:hypothetical protein